MDMSDSRKAMEFMVAFGANPELSPEEQKTAATEFEIVAENALLSHMDNVETMQDEGGEPLNASIYLTFNTADGSHLQVLIRSQQPKDASTQAPYLIALQERGADGSRGRHSYYQLDKDKSCVRRTDVAESMDERAKVNEQFDPTPNFSTMSKEETVAYFEAKAAKTRESLKGFRLETKMGLNNQSVALVEVQKLGQLIEGTTIGWDD